MTLEEMINRKRELGYSNEVIAELSGVPLSTVQKVMSGITKAPRRKTLEALAGVLRAKEFSGQEPKFYYGYPSKEHEGMLELRETAPAYDVRKTYTVEDINALPDGVRAELIDGKIFFMAAPSRTHQKITGEMYLIVANYIRSHGGSCEVYIPPYGVYLNADDKNYVEPDLTVICDLSKSEEKGCVGAPDWIVEVVSPASKRMDYAIKLFKYRSAGVKEYWIINADKRVVMVYTWQENQETAEMYSFEDEIPCSLYPDLRIQLSDVLKL